MLRSTVFVMHENMQDFFAFYVRNGPASAGILLRSPPPDHFISPVSLH